MKKVEYSQENKKSNFLPIFLVLRYTNVLIILIKTESKTKI